MTRGKGQPVSKFGTFASHVDSLRSPCGLRPAVYLPLVGSSRAMPNVARCLSRLPPAPSAAPSSFRIRHSAFLIPHSTFLLPPSPPVIANLELVPLRLNIGKRDRMTERQHGLGRRAAERRVILGSAGAGRGAEIRVFHPMQQLLRFLPWASLAPHTPCAAGARWRVCGIHRLP